MKSTKTWESRILSQESSGKSITEWCKKTTYTKDLFIIGEEKFFQKK